MRPAFLIYCLFLAIEAGLAWLLTGNWFLGAAVLSGLLVYAGVWRVAGPWGELVRAILAGLITVAGPLYYKSALVPTVMCFLALPHLLAATQCFWEMALQKDPAQQNARMRTVVFTVAFYAAMGLVFMLLRGMEPALSHWITTPMALAVLLMALPAWDMARVGRLKPGQGMKSTTGGTARRILVATAAAAGILFLFSFLLPPAAEKLCEISPRWKSREQPPAPPVPGPQESQGSDSGEGPAGTGEANRPGADNSDATGQHQLPEKSNIQSTGEPRLFLKCREIEDARRLAAAPVYVRTHTFDSYKDGVWKSSAVSGSRWLDDASDGAEDGWTRWPSDAPGVRSVEHTVYLKGSDGFSLPALHGVFGFRMGRVYAVPGDQYQVQLTGSVRYDAVSAPVIFDQLPNRLSLRPQETGITAHLECSGGQLLMQLVFREPLLRPENRTLDQKVAGLRQWFTENVRYSTQVKGTPSLTPLDNFLAGERRGYCDFYASAACLILREAGVPARVAYGYAGRSFDEKTGVFHFTDDTAHAWTEIHLRDYGWTVCDFTPQDNIGDLNGPQPQEPPAFDEQSFEEAGKEEKKPEEKPGEEEQPPSLAAWWQKTMDTLQAANPMDLLKRGLLILAVIAGVIALFRWLKHRSTAATAGSFAPDGQQPLYFAEFLRVFRAAGWPPPAGATPREYVSSLQQSGAAGPEFAPMLSYHYATRYAGGVSDSRQESEWLTLVRETERKLQQTEQQKKA
jgi:Transglutaminase-like superfamily